MAERILGGRYRVIRHLARGGMAEVYLAQDELLSRTVAVKVLFSELAQDEQFVERNLAALRPYQVDAELMSHAAKHALFMHCLPAHRGEEVTAEVIDGPRSVVFDQAENRLHAQKALLLALLTDLRGLTD